MRSSLTRIALGLLAVVVGVSSASCSGRTTETSTATTPLSATSTSQTQTAVAPSAARNESAPVSTVAPSLLKVPDVRGMSMSDARLALETDGFEVFVETQHSKTVGADRVISQAPSGDSQAESGSTVKIVVSLGLDWREVPNTAGMTQASAQATLKNAGFKVKVWTISSDTVSPGRVIKQVGGSRATAGWTIQIYVSSGPKPAPKKVVVPDVVGMSHEDAEAALTALGLRITAGWESGTPVADYGKVINQSPKAGTTLNEGSFVQIDIAGSR